MIDTHSHILPGLDDGVPNLDRALSTARLAVQDGIDAIVCTPHRIRGMYENRRTIVIEAVESLALHLEKNDIALSLYPGSELRVDLDIAKKLKSRELLTLNDSGLYALIEMPPEIIPPGIEDFLYSLQIEGIIPVIAHPERNPGLARDPARLYRWVESGVLTQLTAGSLLGDFGGTVRKFSILLLEHGLVHLIATDTHGPNNRAPNLSKAVKSAEEIIGKPLADKIINSNPVSILKGETISSSAPVPFSKRSSHCVKNAKSFSSFLPGTKKESGLRHWIAGLAVCHFKRP